LNFVLITLNILVCGDELGCELHLGIILLISIFVRYNIWLMLDSKHLFMMFWFLGIIFGDVIFRNICICFFFFFFL
jgi:hypothetical protein